MRRGALILLELAAALTAPPAAHARACPVGDPGEGGPSFGRATSTEAGGRLVTRVVVCDRATRQARTLARAEAVVGRRPNDFELRARGRVIWAAAVAGRRVAWVEGRSGTRRSVSRLVVADVSTGRRRSSRVVWRTAPRRLPRLAVALSARGDVAWTTRPRGPSAVNRVVVQRPGGGARTVGSDALALGIEDGRTLRVVGPEDDVRYVDLRRPRTVGGCPARPGFTTALDAGGVLVTERQYEDADPTATYGTSVLLGCVRGTNRDHVLAVDSDFAASVPLAATAPYVLVSRSSGSSANACGLRELTVTNVRLVRFERRVEAPCAGPPGIVPAPERAEDVRLSDAGVPAWTAPSGAETVLVTIDTRRGLRALDRGPRGTIADVEARGTTVTWTAGGVPRQATVG